MRHFWETLTISVTGRESGGHVDIFVPLVETGEECNKLRAGKEGPTVIYLRAKLWPNMLASSLNLKIG